MAKKNDLRIQRANTVINLRSKNQEKSLVRALRTVEAQLKVKFPGIKLHHVTEWKLMNVVQKLRTNFPKLDFHYFFSTSSMRPDGGILSLVDKSGQPYPILISEKKNQGTNDLRALEGKGKQAPGAMPSNVWARTSSDFERQ